MKCFQFKPLGLQRGNAFIGQIKRLYSRHQRLQDAVVYFLKIFVILVLLQRKVQQRGA